MLLKSRREKKEEIKNENSRCNLEMKPKSKLILILLIKIFDGSWKILI